MGKFITTMDEKEFKIFNIFLYILEILLIIILAFFAFQNKLDLILYILIILGSVFIFKSLQRTISLSIFSLLLNDINIDKFENFNKIFYKKPDLLIFNQWNNIYKSNNIAIEFYKGNFNESLDIIEELKRKRISSNIKRSIISFEALNRIFLGENINIEEYENMISKVKGPSKYNKDIEILKNNIRIYYDILIDKKYNGSLIIKRKTNLNDLFNLYLDMNKAYNLGRKNQYENYREELSKNNSQLYIVRKAKAGL